MSAHRRSDPPRTVALEILPLDDELDGARPTVEVRPFEVDPSETLRRWPPAPPPRRPVIAPRGPRRAREALRIEDIKPDRDGGRGRKPTR